VNVTFESVLLDLPISLTFGAIVIQPRFPDRYDLWVFSKPFDGVYSGVKLTGLVLRHRIIGMDWQCSAQAWLLFYRINCIFSRIKVRCHLNGSDDVNCASSIHRMSWCDLNETIPKIEVGMVVYDRNRSWFWSRRVNKLT